MKNINKIIVKKAIFCFLLVIFIMIFSFFINFLYHKKNNKLDVSKNIVAITYHKTTFKIEDMFIKMKDVLLGKYNNDDVEFITDKGFLAIKKNGITYIDGILIANKSFNLPRDYNPGDLTKETKKAFEEMKRAAFKDKINIYIVSGYRSYNHQESLYINYSKRNGKDFANKYSARAGHSEHQTGLAVDLNSISYELETSSIGKWLNHNSYKFGFILRYTKNGEKYTGYSFEPWHFRYVGKDLAEILYNKGNWITLEEYFGIPSKYLN